MVRMDNPLYGSLIGFIYPCYKSFSAIESEDAGDDTQWLTYWVVFSAFTVFEMIFGFLVELIRTFSFLLLAFYYTIKLIGLIFLQIPKYKYAGQIYTTYIRPFFIQHRPKIDAQLTRLQNEGLAYVTELLWKLIDLVKGLVAQGRPASSSSSADARKTS